MSARGDRFKVLAVLSVLLGLIVWGVVAVAGVFACTVVCGCSSARDDVVLATNASADFGGAAEHTLAELDRREQEEAVSRAQTEAEARAGVAAVRKRYAAAWVAYRRFRAAWLAAAAAEHAYDAAVAAKQTPSVATILATAKSLADAEAAFSAAAVALASPTGSEVSK